MKPDPKPITEFMPPLKYMMSDAHKCYYNHGKLTAAYENTTDERLKPHLKKIADDLEAVFDRMFLTNEDAHKDT